jgi:hypothetical protein
MQLLKQAREEAGTGLRGSGRPVTSLFEGRGTKLVTGADIAPKVTLTYVEPATLSVTLEGENRRPATLKGGELTAYTMEELTELKETELAHGKVVHVFRGCVRLGTTVRDGPGAFHYGGGEVFEGRWKQNQRHGIGALYLPTGYVLEAQFKEDRANGRGIEVFPDGEMFVGDFVQGRPNGHGVLYYTNNGSRFEGQWENGEKNGPGVIFYENGDIFQGTWVKGVREGPGITTYASTGRSYQSLWRNDVCEPKMKYVPNDQVPRPVSNAVPVDAVQPLMNSELRQMRVASDLWTEVHPFQFQRIKRAFEEIDTACCGEVEMTYLQSIWDVNNMDTLDQLEKAAATVGAADTLEMIEVLTGLYPHLGAQETKRWIAVDVFPESLLRLRGNLAGVQSPRQDGFYTLTGGASEISLEQVQRNKGLVGGLRVTNAMFRRAEARLGKKTMSFPQLLEQLFPCLWKSIAERCEKEHCPLPVLSAYSADFDDLNDTGSGYLSLEKMKTAQAAYRMAVATGQDIPPTNRYEERMRPGFFKHLVVWYIGDICLTIPLFKAIDKAKTGYISLSELLRVALPNIACLQTRERLGTSSRADEFCRCDICSYCDQKYTKPRPPNPYLDGTLQY